MLHARIKLGLASGAVLACVSALASPVDCNLGPPCDVTIGRASIAYAPDAVPGVGNDGLGFRAKSTFNNGFLVPLNGGLTLWSIDGVNRSFSQTSFFRLGGDSREYSLASLGTETANVDAAAGTITVSYGRAGQTPISVDMIYTLQDAAAGRSSQIIRDVRVTNNTGAAIDLNWFDYSDFDLSAANFNDSASTELHGGAGGTRVITQTDSTGQHGSIVSQWVGISQDGNFLNTQPAGYAIDSFDGELPQFGGRENLLERLLDNTMTELSNEVTNSNTADIIQAVQFRFSGVQGSVIMRDVITAIDAAATNVPEPGTWSLAALGLLAAVASSRRKAANG